MTLVRFQPLRELDNMSNMVRRFIDNATDGISPLEIGNFVPTIDMSEDEKNLIIHVELAGVEKENVKITVSDGNVLSIRGEKKREEKSEGKKYYRLERSYGEFVRNLSLPAEVNPEGITAKYDQGLLTISIPKKVPTRPKELEVKIS